MRDSKKNFDLDDVCEAGRRANFGGRWKVPCMEYGRNMIGNPSLDPIKLCDQHFAEVNEAGLVDETNIDPAEFRRRERRRVGRHGVN